MVLVGIGRCAIIIIITAAAAADDVVVIVVTVVIVIFKDMRLKNWRYGKTNDDCY